MIKQEAGSKVRFEVVMPIEHRDFIQRVADADGSSAAVILSRIIEYFRSSVRSSANKNGSVINEPCLKK